MRYALILAGGSGTRLWPLSRDELPKQLIPVLEGRSLLEEAYSRLEGVVPEDRRLVCAALRHKAAVLARLPELGRDGPNGVPRYLGEPVGRDTLAAIAYSCAMIVREDPDAVVGVFTSDHVIRPRDEFRALAERAYGLVESSPRTLVTFGVVPDRPSTGFGYLELGPELRLGMAAAGPSAGAAAGARRVMRFREKPDAATAAAFVEAGGGRYLWNSGMFVWKAARFLELAARYEPELAHTVSGIASMAGGSGFAEALAAAYPGLKKTSVDYGVMERASQDPEVEIAAVGLGIEWLDIGSWNAYGELLPQDGSRNASSGAAALVECSGTLAVSAEAGHVVACLGCEDLVVVHTPDATLVCPRSRADELKKLYGVVAGLEGGRYR